jgi:lipoprotein-releasing system permease protein
MFAPLELFIGLRFAKSRRKGIMAAFISLASFLGIALGVMVLIIGLSAMNGFERELNNRVLSVIPSAEINATYANIYNASEATSILSKQENVLGASAVINIKALVSKDNVYRAIQIKGIEPNLEETVTPISKFVTAKSLSSLKDGNNIILGKKNAERLHANIGDEIDVYLSDVDKNTGKTSIPKGIKFKVVGFLEISGELDKLLAYIHIDKAREILNYEKDEATNIAFKVTDNYRARELAYDAVKGMLKEYKGSFFVKPWTYSFGYLYQDIQMIRTIMYLALIMVVGVACFNIVSSLIMDVNEKRSEIAILLSMGYSRSRILLTFIVQGSVSGTFGVIAGTIIGTLLSVNLTSVIQVIERICNVKLLNGDVYFIDFVPSEVCFSDVFLVAGIALILSVLASVIPSYISSKINPARELSSK